MTNSVNFDFAFRQPEIAYPIFMEVSEKPSDLATCRTVNHLWKAKCDEFLGNMWGNLRSLSPKGGVDISLAMHEIEGNTPANSFFVMFQKLTDVFRKCGAKISSESIATTVGEFRGLQQAVCDNALKMIWSKQLSELMPP